TTLFRSHPLPGLEADAARVKGDAFAYQRHRGSVAATVVAQHNKLRLLGAALGYAQERAHPQALHLLPAEDGALEPLLPGHGFSPPGQLGRGQLIPGGVDQVPGPVRSLGEDDTPLDAGADRIELAPVHLHDEDLLRRAGVA